MRDLHCTDRTRSVQIRLLDRLFEPDEPFAAGQADRTVIIEVLRRVDVAAFRAYEEPAAVRLVAPGTPATLHQDGVPQVRGGCPDQHPRRIAVAFPQGAADLRAVPFAEVPAFVTDAPFQIVVGRASEKHDPHRRRVAAAQTQDGLCTVMFLQPFGEGHSPEQPFGAGVGFPGGDRGEVVVLHRFDMFAAAAGVEVRERFGPRRGLRHPGRARRRAVQPDEDARRCREQQEYQDQTQFHRVAGSGNSPDCEVHFLCQRRVFSSAAGGFFTRRFWISDFKPYICGPPPRQTRCGADETHETRI